MQLWLSLTPSGQGLVLLERLEGEESISHPSSRASWQRKGNGTGDSPFFSLELPTLLRRAVFWGPLSLQQVQCVQRRMWPPRHFPSLRAMIHNFSLDYIEMGALPMGSGLLILLSTPHHFPEPQDERNQQASWQCGSNFKAHSKIGV